MTSPLLARLTEDYGYQSLGADTLDAFLVDQEHSVLFFAGDPAQYPETLDVAVILPELIRELGGRLTPAVIAPDAEQVLQARFGFGAWPTLVFMRGTGYLGAISRVKDWPVYLERIEGLLAGEVLRPPSVGVPVVDASAPACSG